MQWKKKHAVEVDLVKSSKNQVVSAKKENDGHHAMEHGQNLKKKKPTRKATSDEIPVSHKKAPRKKTKMYFLKAVGILYISHL